MKMKKKNLSINASVGESMRVGEREREIEG